MIQLTAEEEAMVLDAMKDYVTSGGEMDIGHYLDGEGMEHIEAGELREKYMRHRRAAVRLYLRMLDGA